MSFKLVVKEVEQIDDVICDVCGKGTKKEIAKDIEGDSVGTCEYAELKAEWGYGSSADGETHLIHFCEECYRIMLDKMGIDDEKIVTVRIW